MPSTAAHYLITNRRDLLCSQTSFLDNIGTLSIHLKDRYSCEGRLTLDTLCLNVSLYFCSNPAGFAGEKEDQDIQRSLLELIALKNFISSEYWHDTSFKSYI